MASSFPKIGGGTQTCDGRHYAVMNAIKYRLAALELVSFPNDQIEVLKVPLNRGILKAIGHTAYGSDGSAAMVVSPLETRLLKRKNASRDILYRSLLTVFEASNFQIREGLDKHLGWQDAIVDEFDDYPFSEVPGGQRVVINPRTVNPLQTWLRNYDAQSFVLDVTLCVARPWNP